MDGLQWRGLWNATIEYNINDVIYFQNDGFTYICVRKNRPGFLPDNYHSGFELMAGFEVQNLNIQSVDGGYF